LESRSHGGLQVDAVDVLPVLLQKGSQKIACQLRVLLDLVEGHVGVADSDVEGQHLLHLELDGSANFLSLLLHAFAGGDDGREFTGLVKSWAQKTRDLLDQGVGSEVLVVLLGPLFDDLLVLVESLKSFGVHGFDTSFLSLFAVHLGSQHAQLEVGARGVRKLEGSGETLLLLGVVVLQGALEVDSLLELTLLALEHLACFLRVLDLLSSGEGEEVLNGRVEEVGIDLRHLELSQMVTEIM